MLRFISRIAVATLLVGSLPAQDGLNDRLEQLRRDGQESPVYRLGAGDKIEIDVFGVEDLHTQVRISGSGLISFPLLGKVQAEGLSASELEQNLADRMQQADLIRDPQVSVSVLEYRSHPVFILGAVQEPGQYQMTRTLRLIDVISMAGGLDEEWAKGTALIQRSEEKDQIDQEPIEIDLEELLVEGDLSLNVPLFGGDTVNVPRREKSLFYIVGDVRGPGAFEVPADRVLYLTQAIAHAGGPSKTAKTGKVTLLRYQEEGDRQQFVFNLKEIMRGRLDDFEIAADDVIFVPGSTSKGLLHAMAGVVPRTISSAIIRIP